MAPETNAEKIERSTNYRNRMVKQYGCDQEAIIELEKRIAWLQCHNHGSKPADRETKTLIVYYDKVQNNHDEWKDEVYNMTKPLERRISKIEDFAEKIKPQEDGLQKFLDSAPTIWIQDLAKESMALLKRPEIKIYIFVVDISAPKDGHCKYQICFPGQRDFHEFAHNLLKKPERIPEHIKIFPIVNSSDF